MPQHRRWEGGRHQALLPYDVPVWGASLVVYEFGAIIKKFIFVRRTASEREFLRNIEYNPLKPFIEELGIDSVFVNDYLGLE